MTESQNKANFWTTLPGILTGLAALVTALAGLWVAVHSIVSHPPVEQKSSVVGTQPGASETRPGVNQQLVPVVPPPVVKKKAIITEVDHEPVTVDADTLTWMMQKEIRLDNGRLVPLDQIKKIVVSEVRDFKSMVQISMTDGETINDSVMGGSASPSTFEGYYKTQKVQVYIGNVKQIEIVP